MQLPIDPLRDTFLDALAEGHVVLSAATGSGKSTRLPLWAMEQGAVLVVEPRRVACTALANYLAAESGTQAGERVGYAIRFDNRLRSDTPLVFVTPGIALRWLSDDQLARFQTVIIDEFHERRWDTDLLLALLKQAGQHHLVLTSATLAAASLTDYLGGRHLQGEGRSYPVSVSYQSAEPRGLPTAAGLEKRLVAAVNVAMAQTDGDLLVFLPGRGEIRQAQQVLQGVAADVIPLHATVTPAEQKKALNQQPERRVILATNVAETSLTIPGVTAVIDSGLERRTSQRNGRTVLSLTRISRASAEQRKGRAGRTAPGICLRLWGEHGPLEEQTPPEIRREELSELVLAAGCAGQAAASLGFPDNLPEKSLALAESRLRELQAIDDQGLATDHGRALFSLPLDSLFAHLITAMPDILTRAAMIDLAAILSTRPRLIKLPDDELARQKLQQWQPLACDAMTLICALHGTVPEEIPVDRRARREAQTLALQIRNALAVPTDVQSTAVDRDHWMRSILRAAPSLAYIRREKRRHAMGNGFAELTPADESRFAEDQEAALVLDEHHRPGRQGHKQIQTLGTCLAPIPVKWLVEAGLGEMETLRAGLENGLPFTEEQRRYAGRIIDRQQRIPGGEALRSALADLILAGRKLKPAGKQLQMDIAQWSLYVALNELDETVPEPADWLQSRLAQLGLEEAGDIALVDPEDIRFHGIPEWEREAFDRQYPRQVSLGDLRLDVNYHPKVKRITLEKRGGQRRGEPRRWELPAWTGWKVRYKQASKVTDVK